MDMESHQFRLIVNSECFGQLISNIAQLSISQMPVAHFDYNKAGQLFSFTNQSQNEENLLWDFGDGSSSMAPNPSHSFPPGSTFTVILTAINQCGNDQFSVEISTAPPPTAAISSENPRSCAPHTISFSGAETENATAYFWDFPGGTPRQSVERNPVVSYSDPGIYDVYFYALNSAGADSIILEDYVTILPAPIADFTFTIDGNTVFFENLSQNATDFQWDFGDGSAVSNGLNPSHTYSTPDYYTVTMEGRNDFCSSAKTASFEIVIPTSTNQIIDPKLISLFPNPAFKELKLSWAKIPVTQIYLLSISGQQLDRFEVERQSEITLDLGSLPRGIYLLQFRTPESMNYKKLIKID